MLVAFALMLFAGSAEAQSSLTCRKLTAEFDANEYQMATMHDLNVQLHNIDMEALRAMSTPKYIAEAKSSAQKIKDEDAEYLATGDRITTLMVAHKCEPPDHVTSAFTYSTSNPHRKEYQPPRKAD